MRIVMGLVAASALLFSACTASPSSTVDDGAKTSSKPVTSYPFEYSWREQTTKQVRVEVPYVCDGVLYCENPFPTSKWVTVPGDDVFRTDYLCATSVDEARSMVAGDVTLTGRDLDPLLCPLKAQSSEDVDEPEVDDYEVDETEIYETEVDEPEVVESEEAEPGVDATDFDEELAYQEYLDEGEMYDQDSLAGYSKPLSVSLAGEQREDVRVVQRWLRQQGFAPGADDGYFGAATANSVRRFQRYVGLSIDGVVGEDTWSALSAGLGY